MTSKNAITDTNDFDDAWGLNDSDDDDDGFVNLPTTTTNAVSTINQSTNQNNNVNNSNTNNNNNNRTITNTASRLNRYNNTRTRPRPTTSSNYNVNNNIQHNRINNNNNRSSNSTTYNNPSPSTASTTSVTSHTSQNTPNTHNINKRTRSNYSHSNSKSTSNKLNNKPNNIQFKQPKKPNTNLIKTNNSNNNQMKIDYNQLSWLKLECDHLSKSRVLSSTEITEIFNLPNIRDINKCNMIKQRINHLTQYSSSKISRTYSGICSYDSKERINRAIELITAFRKINNEKIKKSFAGSSNPSNAADEAKKLKDRTESILTHKELTAMLEYYQSLIKQKNTTKISNNNNSSIKRIHNNNNKNQANMNMNMKKSLSYTTGYIRFGPKDEFNTNLNPVYTTLHRGHILDEERYNAYMKVLNYNSDNDIDMDNKENDVKDNDNNNSDEDIDYPAILGPAGPRPPCVDMLTKFRNLVSSYGSEIAENHRNMILLYGINDASKKSSSAARYSAHLLSEFNVLQKVGSGVYGQVFKAKSKKTKKLVAIKSLKLLHTGDMAQNIRNKNNQLISSGQGNYVNNICPYINQSGISMPIIREIVALKQLSHDNITKLYDVVINDPLQSYLPVNDPLRKSTVLEYNKGNQQSTRWNLHLVMEFIPNELCALMKNLKILHIKQHNIKNKHFPQRLLDITNPDKLRNPPIEPLWFSCSNVKSIIHDLLTGLQYLKQECYIHRDLKPANILLTDNGKVKIADFGLSRPKYKNKHLTNGRNVVTRYYRAPEILIEQRKRKSHYGLESDMWSVGAIFAELITGRPIFRADDDCKQLAAIMHLCGDVNELSWPGVNNITYRDPQVNCINPEGSYNKKDETYKWYSHIKAPLAINQAFIPKKNRKRRLRECLEKFIKNSWTDTNIQLGLDLLDKILQYSPKLRITPEEALNHKWFKLSPYAKAPKDLIKISHKAKSSSHTDLQQQQIQHKLMREQQQRKQQNQNKNISITQQKINEMNRRRHGNNYNPHKNIFNNNNNINNHHHQSSYDHKHHQKLYNQVAPTYKHNNSHPSHPRNPPYSRNHHINNRPSSSNSIPPYSRNMNNRNGGDNYHRNMHHKMSGQTRGGFVPNNTHRQYNNRGGRGRGRGGGRGGRGGRGGLHNNRRAGLGFNNQSRRGNNNNNYERDAFHRAGVDAYHNAPSTLGLSSNLNDNPLKKRRLNQ